MHRTTNLCSGAATYWAAMSMCWLMMLYSIQLLADLLSDTKITHGFDDQGAKYDKEGNLNNWWTSSDSVKFLPNQTHR